MASLSNQTPKDVALQKQYQGILLDMLKDAENDCCADCGTKGLFERSALFFASRFRSAVALCHRTRAQIALHHDRALL
jgi:hypothetical protein